jgi:hypothetical protein
MSVVREEDQAEFVERRVGGRGEDHLVPAALDGLFGL